MVKRNVKTLEHGLIVLSTTPKHAQDWDKHLPKILFRYKGGVQANTKVSPHMLIIEWIPMLKADNFLNPLVQDFESNDEPIIMVEQMLNTLQFIAMMHGEVVKNVNQTQVKQKQTYVSWKGKQMFLRFKEQ